MTQPVAAPSRRSEIATERLLFALLLLLHAAVYVWLILDRRMVRGHDSLLSFVLQYLFQAHATQSSEPMLWIPYVIHGRVSNFSMEAQGALLQNAMLLLGGAPQGTSMLPLFYVTLFVDDLLLLTGIWWLGRRFYRSPYTRFFVASAALGSGMWANQVFFNHRLIYALPLILAALHDFLEDGRRWKLLLAGTLMSLLLMGQVFYLPLMTLLMGAVYFGAFALIHPRELRAWRTHLRPRWTDLGVVLLLGSLLAAVGFTLTQGAGEVRLYRPGRNPDGTVTLDSYLTYAGALSPVRYADLFLGITPSMDYSLYFGVFAVACLLAAPFLKPGKQVLHLSICLVLGVLISAGFLNVPAAAAYELFYPIRYFRHITLGSPIVQLLALFLAGCGFDALLTRWASRQPTPLFRGLLLYGLGLVIAAWAAPVDIFNAALLVSTGMSELGIRCGWGGPHVVTVLAAVASGTLLWFRFRRAHPSTAWILAVLLLQTADIYRWKFHLLLQETETFDERQVAVQRIQPFPYVPRRNGDYDSNERYRALHPTFLRYGAIYDYNDMLIHVDPPRSRFEASYWLAPYDLLLRAYLRMPLDSPTPPPKDRGIGEPVAARLPPSPYRKVIGADEDKIQVFADAHVARSDQELADAMNRPEFRGDVLLLSPRAGVSEAASAPDAGLLSRNERLPVAPEVLHFDANRIRIRVTLPEGRSEGWLSYADVWHSEWTAQVNGQDAEVRRSFLAYKAVKLTASTSDVEFRFRSPRRVWSYRLLSLASLLTIGAAVGRLLFLFRVPGA